MRPRLAPFIQNVQLINERLISCTIRVENRNYNLYQIYVPQEGQPQGEKDEFMELLDLQLEGQREATKSMMRDFDARVGLRGEELKIL